jgi:putative transposase
MVSWVTEAVIAGARKRKACEMTNISIRTLQRWSDEDGCVGSDKRPDAVHPAPKSSLSDTERERILSVCSEKEFASLPPNTG